MRRRFMLQTSAICMVGLPALVLLAADLLGLSVSRDELDASLDRAALAASFELDGTSQGIERARAMARSIPVAAPGRGLPGAPKATDFTVQFAAKAAGPFSSAPPSPAGQRFVRVRASATVDLLLLALVPGAARAQSLSASAVAGPCLSVHLPEGPPAFVPDAGDPGFGFVAGQFCTM